MGNLGSRPAFKARARTCRGHARHHPSDKPESFTLRIRVPKGLVVAANGKLIEVLDHDDGTRTYRWDTAFPISNYNVALNIAPYDTLTTNYPSVSGEIVPVTYWVLPENRAKGEKLVPEMLEHLNFYERVLGPYPFRGEKYGVAETPHLGMEHQSIIAYGNKYRGGPHGYDWLHHHELGHEWWGNLVTAEDWRHLWIHEGLGTYMQALYAEEREGLMAYHHALYENRRHISNQHALVPEKPTGIEVMDRDVGNDVYYKGAWVVHMLRYLIGTDQTRTVLRRFAYPTPEMEKLADGSACRFVSTADFVQESERVSNHGCRMKETIHPGDMVVPDQFIDRTVGRPSTFFSDGTVGHISFADPVCPDLSRILFDAGTSVGANVERGGTYLCIEGPQFSTRAESRLYRSWGVDVIGMTNIPEAKLAREAEICYATIAFATDYDCWHGTEADVSIGEVLRILAQSSKTAKQAIREAIKHLPDARQCVCATALQQALITDKAMISEQTKNDLKPIIGKYIS